jgi:putative protease
MPKPLGLITHFYGNLKVAIIKVKTPFSAGAKLRFKGYTTDFECAVKEIQYMHKSIAKAKKGLEVGIKVPKRVREGDAVYFAEEKKAVKPAVKQKKVIAKKKVVQKKSAPKKIKVKKKKK